MDGLGGGIPTIKNWYRNTSHILSSLQGRSEQVQKDIFVSLLYVLQNVERLIRLPVIVPERRKTKEMKQSKFCLSERPVVQMHAIIKLPFNKNEVTKITFF